MQSALSCNSILQLRISNINSVQVGKLSWMPKSQSSLSNTSCLNIFLRTKTSTSVGNSLMVIGAKKALLLGVLKYSLFLKLPSQKQKNPFGLLASAPVFSNFQKFLCLSICKNRKIGILDAFNFWLICRSTF